jgi:hypothetical protein
VIASLTSRFSKSMGALSTTVCALSFLLQVTGCTPKIQRFNITIASNPALAASDIASRQGSTHICPNSSIHLDWAVEGRAAVSAAAGARYQLPACFHLPNPPSIGTYDVSTNTAGIVGSCGGHAVFRLTASKSPGHGSGPCPGPECPNADHEVIMASDLSEGIGDRIASCVHDAYEVAITKPAINWDDRYQVSIVSVDGTGVGSILEKTPGRTLVVLHDGKQSTFTAGALTSDAFRGSKISGTWTLRLSGCASPPSALIANAHANCK